MYINENYLPQINKYGIKLFQIQLSFCLLSKKPLFSYSVLLNISSHKSGHIYSWLRA